jgi:hypothetical protein
LGLVLAWTECTSEDLPAGPMEQPQLARTFQEMHASGKEIDTHELRALGSLVQQYLAKNAGQDPERLQLAVRSLAADLAGSGLPFTPENAAMVVGGIISGFVRHIDQTGAKLVKRKELFTKLAGSTGDLGETPGRWETQVSEILRGLSSIYSEFENQVPKSQAIAWMLAGHVEGEWAELGRPSGWSREDVGRAVDWLGKTLRANGFGS